MGTDPLSPTAIASTEIALISLSSDLHRIERALTKSGALATQYHLTATAIRTALRAIREVDNALAITFPLDDDDDTY